VANSGNKIPNRVLRGLRSTSMPPGYMLGRVSPGEGPVELLPLGTGSAASVSQIVGPGGGTEANVMELGFWLAGIFAPNTAFSGAISAKSIFLPSIYAASYAYAVTPATYDITLYFVTDLEDYEDNGYPNGVAAEVLFEAGENVGIITWLIEPTTIGPTTIPYAVTPNEIDPSLAGVHLLFIGDPTGAT
jgi:hypothetical protein